MMRHRHFCTESAIGWCSGYAGQALPNRHRPAEPAKSRSTTSQRGACEPATRLTLTELDQRKLAANITSVSGAARPVPFTDPENIANGSTPMSGSPALAPRAAGKNAQRQKSKPSCTYALRLQRVL